MSSGFARLGDASFGLLFIDILTLLSFHMLRLTQIVLDLSGSNGLDLTTMLSLQYIVTEAKKLQVGSVSLFLSSSVNGPPRP